MSDQAKRAPQPAYVLHSYPYRESSLVIEAFTREGGRVAMVARGARRPKSNLRGVLLAFQPIHLSWFGRAELKTLHSAERFGAYFKLEGLALLCGFYVNELTMKLLARDDPHERLFEHYEATLQRLAHGLTPQTVALRLFERDLLRELGYAFELEREAKTAQPVIAERDYAYEVEHGPVPAAATLPAQRRIRGQTLLDLARGEFSSSVSLQQSKLLLRMLIDHYLGTQQLNTRQLLRDLQQI